jgi:hypothetical protein
MEPPTPAPGWTPTLRHEWTFLIVMILVIAASIALQALVFPEALLQGQTNPLSIVGGLSLWLAHAGWISLDRRRRGHEVGAWRFFAIFFGPLAIWAYLVIEYRLKGLALVWLSLGAYVLAYGLGYAGAVGILALTGAVKV